MRTAELERLSDLLGKLYEERVKLMDGTEQYVIGRTRQVVGDLLEERDDTLTRTLNDMRGVAVRAQRRHMDELAGQARAYVAELEDLLEDRDGE